MADQPSRGADQIDPERAPLLPREQEETPPSESRAKKTAAWFARHAVLIFVGLLFIAVIAILVGFVKQSQEAKPAAKTCLTPSCIHASSEILYNLDRNYKDIDPCTDFRQLTCGGWDERHDLRPDQGDAFTGTIMAEESQTLLRHILEEPYPDDSKHSSFSPAQLVKSLSSVDRDNFNKLKSAYDACMNEDAIKKEGIKPLMKILHSIVTAFPVSQSSSPDEQDIAGAIDLLARLGVSALVAFGTGADDKDPDVVVVQVASPNPIGLPAKDYYKDDNVVQSYETSLAQVLEAVHPASSAGSSKAFAKWVHFDQIKDLAHEVVGFEKKLADASPDAEDRDDVNKYYNPMSLEDADLLTPQIHLATTIHRFAPPDVKVDGLIMMAPTYMKALSTIISSTPKEVLQTYFMWKVIQAYSSAVEADELTPYSRFKNQIQGKDPDSRPERWRTCVNHVDGGVGFILSRFFVEKAFSEKAKNLGDQIVSDIKEMFIEKLKITSWMDENVVDLAIEKVHKIVQKIGYPTKSPNIMDPPSLRDYYGALDITSSFFDNHLAINSFDFSREWAALGSPVDRDRWDMTVPTVNAYYNPPGNEIVFPAGIMQFPVFDVQLPQYISYGAFGSVSGHELSHAFDSTGRHYDQNGNYTDWWTNSTVAGFMERADCFVDQYHNFTIPGADGNPIHVNGKLTLGENIADAGGVSAAFAAWKKRRAETPNEDLPGLDYFTQEQLFFVSYGNWWCGKSRKEAAISRIYTDPHSPVWARILGTMANSRDFRESFNCPVKEPVCELW